MYTVEALDSLREKVIEIVDRAAALIKDSPFRIDEKAGPVNIVTYIISALFLVKFFLAV